MVTKKERQLREHLRAEWPRFHQYRLDVLSQTQGGRRLSERDVEQIFEQLVTGPLEYRIFQVGRQQDYADYTLVDRGMKLAVAEIKRLGWFDRDDRLDDALMQAARYADRHRTPNLIAFDGTRLCLARRDSASKTIKLVLDLSIDGPSPHEDLFYFSHYGLFRYPVEPLRVMDYDHEQDDFLYKKHHGVLLHHSCFAYVGDLRDKQTWKMPYRNEDFSVDTRRIGHAVNYLLSPGGYRGQKADRDHIPEAATVLCALKLARAYQEMGKWEPAEDAFSRKTKPSSQKLLWLYLHQHGIELD